jgi:hypothetical protein
LSTADVFSERMLIVGARGGRSLVVLHSIAHVSLLRHGQVGNKFHCWSRCTNELLGSIREKSVRAKNVPASLLRRCRCRNLARNAVRRSRTTAAIIDTVGRRGCDCIEANTTRRSAAGLHRTSHKAFTASSRRVCDRFLALVDWLRDDRHHVGILGMQRTCILTQRAPAATTANIALLDNAVVRNGRFCETVTLQAPTEAHARVILARRMQSLLARSSSTPVDAAAIDALSSELAFRCKGFVGADLEALCDLAALATLHVSLQRLRLSRCRRLRTRCKWKHLHWHCDNEHHLLPSL